jgi:hypothetical protein
MIFFSVGLPGSFAEWCDAVVSRLAQYALGSVEVVRLNTPSKSSRLLRSGAARRISLSAPVSPAVGKSH